MAILRKNLFIIIRLISLYCAASAFLFIQCADSTGPSNSPPVILSLIPSKRNVNFLDTITIKADVNDAEGDSIIFLWTSDRGSFSFISLDSAIWDAPDFAGSANIILSVSDVFNGTDADSVSIAVENQPPLISSVTASENNILVGNIITLTAEASDPDGGQLSFSWEAEDGEFIGSATESIATWRAATTVSSVTITVTVTDNNNDSALKGITINVFQELGSVWVADTFNDQIVKLAPDGTQLFRISGFNRPQGLAVDIADRTLWIADWGGNRVLKYSAEGEQLIEVTGFDRPTDITVRANGNVWITSMSDSNQVVEISHTGTIERKLSGFTDPQAIDVNRLTDEIWVADSGNDRIVRLNAGVPDGYNLDSINVVPIRFDNQLGNYARPKALEINQETGECWVVDTGNHRVVRISTDLNEFFIAGFFNPEGLAVNKKDGSCWVANTGENEVVKIFSDIFTLPNSQPAAYNIDSDAGFHFIVPDFIQPWAIDINVNDNIVWFAENFRLVKILDNGTGFSLLREFTNFNAPKALIVNPGSNF